MGSIAYIYIQVHSLLPNFQTQPDSIPRDVKARKRRVYVPKQGITIFNVVNIVAVLYLSIYGALNPSINRYSAVLGVLHVALASVVSVIDNSGP